MHVSCAWMCVLAPYSMTFAKEEEPDLRRSSRIAMLAGESASSRIIYHALVEHFGPVELLLEDRPSPVRLLKGRVKRFGFLHVTGQLLFQVGLVPILRRQGRSRIAQILSEHRLQIAPIQRPFLRVSSANASETHGALRRTAPRVVVVNGTRILSKATISSVPCPFINTHAGITPAYRGVHGGYWALADGKPELVGTTIHLVDEGIDTGSVIERVVFKATPKIDNFATYPYLHVAAGVPALIRALEAVLAGRLEIAAPQGQMESKLRSHPTIWTYVHRRVTAGVR